MILQWSMYYLSFAPLWLSVLFMDVMSLVKGTANAGVEWISIVLIPVAFVVCLIIMLRHLKPGPTNSQKYTLKSAEEEKFLTAEFLFSYIFPLFAFDFTQWEGMALFALFFLIFGCLCAHHNYFCTNIMLDIFKYKIYSCDLIDSDLQTIHKKVVSHRELRLCCDDSIYAKGLNNDYFIDCN